MPQYVVSSQKSEYIIYIFAKKEKKSLIFHFMIYKSFLRENNNNKRSPK